MVDKRPTSSSTITDWRLILQQYYDFADENKQTFIAIPLALIALITFSISTSSFDISELNETSSNSTGTYRENYLILISHPYNKINFPLPTQPRPHEFTTSIGKTGKRPHWPIFFKRCCRQPQTLILTEIDLFTSAKANISRTWCNISGPIPSPGITTALNFPV